MKYCIQKAITVGESERKPIIVAVRCRARISDKLDYVSQFVTPMLNLEHVFDNSNWNTYHRHNPKVFQHPLNAFIQIEEKDMTGYLCD